MSHSAWESVAYSDPGGGYEWDAFDVRWTGDRFAWSNQHGCSCLGFVYTDDRYQVGDKYDLLRAISEWGGGSYGDASDVVRLIAKIHEFGH